jgi:hypothetical protein
MWTFVLSSIAWIEFGLCAKYCHKHAQIKIAYPLFELKYIWTGGETEALRY